jgi:hypothetical protein
MPKVLNLPTYPVTPILEVLAISNRFASIYSPDITVAENISISDNSWLVRPQSTVNLPV